ncbi:MAG: phosphodiester glycosidase family protein [Planctomycetaceae bacterium]|jgi:exopolysaccharide biosynthesis protein|nr:phosphodiester glycosidase family protein [Planctomycetaceae bacterium]
MLRFISFLYIILCTLTVLAQESELRPNPETPVWTPIFKGVEKAQTSSTQPRLQQVFAIRIDTNTKGISFFTTPKANENYQTDKKETVRQQTSEFLKEYHLQVAVNANFFSVPAGEQYSLPGIANVGGLAISDGSMVSPPEEQLAAAFLVLKTGQVLLKNCSDKNMGFSNIQVAVTGNKFLLQNGTVLPQTNKDIHPRTLCGISQDNRYVIWVVIDGRRKGYSEGATFEESAQWLHYFDAWDGLNLDGGGSSTLVIQGKNNDVEILNRPSNNNYLLRYNANNIGIKALPLSQTD